MRIREETIIRRPAERVFRWIEDPELARRWQPEVIAYQITETVPGMVGTEFREVIGDARGRLELRGRVTAYQPGALMEFDLRGRGLRLRARYALSPAGGDRTRLRVDTDLRIGGCLSFLVQPFVRRRVARQQHAEIEQLRRLCEAEAPAPA